MRTYFARIPSGYSRKCEDLHYNFLHVTLIPHRIDSTMLGAIERYMKQAIVDKNAMVSSSALVAGPKTALIMRASLLKLN